MKQYGYAGAGIVAGFLIALLMLPQAHSAANAVSAYSALDRFGSVFERVRENYVREVSDEELVDGALKGMVSSLDPHSNYLNAKESVDMEVQTTGEYGGLGLEVTMEDGMVKVVAPIDDTPAAHAGIKTDDYIVRIDGQPLIGDLNDAVDKMRGPNGTKTTITIVRKGMHDPFDVTLTRTAIVVHKVKSRRAGDIGYIRMSSFDEHTTEGLNAAVSELKKGTPLKGYILDLRGNPGGLVNQAAAVSDAFLEGGEIVTTRGRRADDIERYEAHPGDITGGKPLVVLINEGTASAAEIVAGALQDHKRATLIGTISFGKGSVQTSIPLGAGQGILLLTTGRYYTPSGRSIQAMGIDPDIVVAQDRTDEKTRSRLLYEADLPSHLEAQLEGKHVSKQMPIVPEADKKYDDFQMTYAIAYLDGKARPGVTQKATSVASAP